MKDNKNFISVKLFTQEEDAEKQKKINFINNQKESKPRLDLSEPHENEPNSINSVVNSKISCSHREANISVVPNTQKEKEEDVFSESFLEGLSQFGIDEQPSILEDNKNSSSFYIDQINQNSMINPPLQVLPQFFPMAPQLYPCNTFPVFYQGPLQPCYPCPDSALKYVCNYDIQIENDTKFKVTRRLIGNKGLILKKVLYDSSYKFGDNSTKIRLRGRGSGYKEGVLLKGKFIDNK